jgi:hypothetical protein
MWVFFSHISYTICLLFFISILLLYWGYIVTFTKVLTTYLSQIHPLHHSLLSLYLSLLRIVLTGLVPFSCMNTEYSTIFTLLYLFLTSSPLVLIPTPRQALLYLSVLHFWENTFFVVYLFWFAQIQVFLNDLQWDYILIKPFLNWKYHKSKVHLRRELW